MFYGQHGKKSLSEASDCALVYGKLSKLVIKMFYEIEKASKLEKEKSNISSEQLKKTKKQIFCDKLPQIFNVVNFSAFSEADQIDKLKIFLCNKYNFCVDNSCEGTIFESHVHLALKGLLFNGDIHSFSDDLKLKHKCKINM